LVLGPLLGQDQPALLVLLLEDEGLDHVAGGDDLVGVDVVADRQLPVGDDPFRLVADVEQHLVLVDLDHGAGDDVALVELDDGARDGVGERHAAEVVAHDLHRLVLAFGVGAAEGAVVRGGGRAVRRRGRNGRSLLPLRGSRGSRGAALRGGYLGGGGGARAFLLKHRLPTPCRTLSPLRSARGAWRRVSPAPSVAVSHPPAHGNARGPSAITPWHQPRSCRWRSRPGGARRGARPTPRPAARSRWRRRAG